MIRYIRYIWRVIIMTFGSMVTYRSDFTLRILRAITEVAIAVVAINAFYAHVPTIAGWNRYEALTVFAFYSLISSLVLLIFGQGIDNLHEDITSGQFDRYLTMPIDSQIASGTRFIFITNAFRLLFNAGLLAYVLQYVPVQHAWYEWVLVLAATLSGAAVYYSIMFAASLVSFWAFSGEATFLTHSIATVSRYPLDFFSVGIQRILYVIPLAFVAYIPASVTLGRHYLPASLSPIIAVACLWLVRQLWHAGLRSYSSASS